MRRITIKTILNALSPPAPGHQSVVSMSLMPVAVIWNLPSLSGKQGESTTFAERSAPRPFLNATLRRVSQRRHQSRRTESSRRGP